jgi:molybdate transport system substrate-binding protein
MIRRSLLAAFVASAPLAVAAEPMILAAASTGRAMDAALIDSGIKAVTSYGASGMLARQIEQGAPADLFISANPKWMDYLVDGGLVEADKVQVLMSNALVLIAPAGTAPIAPEDIKPMLDGESFVMADPTTAPVGAYGQKALETLNLWSDISESFVPMRNTLATVATVASGDAALGLVYASDAAGQEGVAIVWHIPEDSHPAIRYLIAPLAQGEDTMGAEALMAYLGSTAGSEVLAGFGFLPVAKEVAK